MNAFSGLIALGTVLGLVWIALRAPEKSMYFTLDAGLLSLAGMLVGGRLAYTLVAWNYFQKHLLEIPQFWSGGFSGIGAFAGAVLGLLVASRFLHTSFPELVNALLPLALTVSVSSWLACWLQGSAYGLPASGWWAFPAKDEWGLAAPRWPVQLMGALGAGLWFGLLDWLAGSWSWLKTEGRAGFLGLLGLSLQLFGLSYLRGDQMAVWSGLRLDAWGALALAVIFLALFLATLFMPAWFVSRGEL